MLRVASGTRTDSPFFPSDLQQRHSPRSVLSTHAPLTTSRPFFPSPVPSLSVVCRYRKHTSPSQSSVRGTLMSVQGHPPPPPPLGPPSPSQRQHHHPRPRSHHMHPVVETPHHIHALHTHPAPSPAAPAALAPLAYSAAMHVPKRTQPHTTLDSTSSSTNSINSTDSIHTTGNTSSVSHTTKMLADAFSDRLHLDTNANSDSPSSPPPPPPPAPHSSKSALPLVRPGSPSRRMSASASFSSSLMAKPNPMFNTGVKAGGDGLMDIESCIDNPILAPLGRHVNKRRLPRRVDKDHIDINVVGPSSPATFIQQQEREAHAPVTSLILRRRRLDCEQLERYLQNLQPTLDPHTLLILQSPLLHLTELDLSRNRLSTLPANITSLFPSLIYLNLSHNQFSEIPLELCRLTRLQVLIMSQNRIEGPVPMQICSSLTQLKTLRLCANQITSLPHTLARLDKLESLSMGSVYGGNLLTAFPARCIQFMSALRELDLSHNKLCFLPTDIGHPQSHLRQLVASDNKLEAIPKSIGQCRELRSLNLGRNQLTSLPCEIADLKQLDTLDLSENLLCVIPGDVADFLTKTTLLLTGNPFTRGYCDASRNPRSEIGGLGINYPADDDRYAAVLRSLSRRAILNSAATSSSSSSHTPTLSNQQSGRESPRISAAAGEHGYEMDQDERLDYHLYYTRHALSSRPPSRAESVSSLNENGGPASDYGSAYGGSWSDPYGGATGASTPRVNVEAVISDIDSFFEHLPTVPTRSNTTITTTAISSTSGIPEPSIFEGTSLSAPSTPVMATPSPEVLSPQEAPQSYSVVTSHYHNNHIPEFSSIVPSTTPRTDLVLPTTTSSPIFFPSLLELAARAVLHRGQPLPLEYMPEQVVDYLQPGARPCGLCRRPYVKEWVSSVRVKSYLGHPAVARRVRFCSAACWKTAGEQLEAEEEAATARGPGAMTSPSTPSLTPGARTGHLPPVLMLSESSRAARRRSTSMSQDKDPESPLSSLLPSPVSQGMRVCKGGQTYWPVIGRQRRDASSSVGGGRARSSSSASSTSITSSSSSYLTPVNLVTHTVDESGSITETTSTSKRETNVCSGGCLGGGVCEW